MKYAQSTGGFYIESIHGENIPADAVDITDEQYAALMAGQEAGQQITPDEDGFPVLVWPSPTPISRISALQGLLAIDASGLADEYEAWANSPARTFSERAFINKAQDWRRDDATLAAAATALGLTSAQVDAMFELAATL